MKKVILVVLWILTIALIALIVKCYFFPYEYKIEEYPTFKGEVKKRVNEDFERKRKTLIKVIWCEDRRSEKAMRMVFSVIYHRARVKTLDELYQVAVKPKQFSCLNDPNILLNQKRNKADLEMKKIAEKIVDEFLSGKFKPVVRATHYYQKELIKRPKWAKNKIVVAEYKGHVFLD